MSSGDTTLYAIRPHHPITPMNFANKIKKVSLMSTGKELEYIVCKTGAGYSYIKITLPENIRDQVNYTVEIETEEVKPIFQSFSD